MKEAERLKGIEFSPIRIILEEVRERKAKGEDICSLCAGEPDFNTPEPIKKAVYEKLLQNRTHYSSNRGVLELRRAIADRMEQDCGVTYDAETELLITTGGAEAIGHVMTAFVNPGDEVIILTPAFINYSAAARLCGAHVVEVPLSAANGFQPDIERLKKAITEKTKMVVINNPCNPTGTVYEKEALKQLCALALKHNFLIFSDEIYAKLTYGKNRFYSVSEFYGMKKQAIIMNGFSKAYAMTGWRVGYLMAEREAVNGMLKVHQYATTSGNTFVQEGLALAMNLEETLERTEAMRKRFEARSIQAVRGLEKIKEIKFAEPQGAFYILMDVSETGYTGKKFAEELLKKEKTAVVPAESFGNGCKYMVRISFAETEEIINEGIRRIHRFINNNSVKNGRSNNSPANMPPEGGE